MIEEKGMQDLESRLHKKKDETVKLDVKYATNTVVRFDSATGKMVEEQVKLRSYNGKLMGPLIERRPGDTLLVAISNFLPHEESEHEEPGHEAPEHGESGHDEPGSDTGHENGMHGLNTTNLHVHGLHVSPAGNSDNVKVQIAPGEHFHYEIKIPNDHPPGTYWYHAHKHGSTAVQVASGMAGPLIIRGAIDELPPIRAAKEHIFFFQEILFRPGVKDPDDPSQVVNGLDESDEPFRPGLEGMPSLSTRLGLRFSVNGEFEPTIHMARGDVHRWRFLHAGAHERLEVRLVSEDDPQKVIPQYQIAHDGITTGRLDKVETTELYSGYRTDVLVHAVEKDGTPLAPGVYLLMDMKEDADLVPERRVLARIVVKRWPVRHRRLPTEEELKPHALPPIELDEDEKITEQKVVFSSAIDPATGVATFLINGKQFDPDDPPLQLKLGRVDRWVITSIDPALPGNPNALDHTFHIHVNPFMVEMPDGKVLWKDTIVVLPQQTVKLLTRYERYIGVFPFHCHILFHEDHGMMQFVEVKEGEANHAPGPH
ncbi:multicopper oxidase domain-containing protein [Archangium violaceum]|uniref:multicopper oxidase family protein n=1 Tax=Archangium violaceum TaxID=83451 RepID=UPI00194F3D9D|nr:multicopper oxidase family protein [Archangium violaceum]QRN95348.1 multicopper oxidase domain-containing protein [Archangium violaceum]